MSELSLLDTLGLFFDPIEEPTCVDDWRAKYVEQPQTVSDFAQDHKMTHDSHLYLVTLGINSTTKNNLRDLASALVGRNIHSCQDWFLGKKCSAKKKRKGDLETYQWIEVCETLASSSNSNKKKRKQQSILGHVCARISTNNHNRQLCVDHLLNIILEQVTKNETKFKKQAKVMLMVTEDLFSDDSDLFVAGLASPSEGVAVFSIYRYAYGFYWNPDGYWFDYGFSSSSSTPVMPPYTSVDATNLTEEAKEIELLRRYARLCAHEMMHLFGIDHCLFYRCIMNGSGHLVEDFRQPLLPCPIDMNKLCHINSTSITKYLTNLLDALRRHSLLAEATFVSNMIISK